MNQYVPPPRDMQVPNWSSLGRLKRGRFPSLSGGGHSFGGGAGQAVAGHGCRLLHLL